MTGESPSAVWTYWEDVPGTTRPAYLDLCLETIRRHAAPLPLHCLGPDDALEVLPDLDVERWRSLPAPNYRSDYVRCRLLQRYGGLWIDIDTVALRPLAALLAELDARGTVSFGMEQGRFFGGLSAAAAGSAFVDMWVAEQDEVLTRHRDWATLPYAALAQDVTWSVARKTPWKPLPMAEVAPIPWYQWRRFFSRLESPRHLLAAKPVTVVLWNAAMGPALRGVDAGQLARSRMLLSRLLRIGLGTSDVNDEEDGWTALHRLSALRFSRLGQGAELTMRRLARRK